MLTQAAGGTSPGLVYVAHLEAPLAHARHYVGWTKDSWNLRLRLAHHRAGNGSAFLRAVGKAGIRFQLVAVTEGTRHDERRVKDGGHVGLRHCPVCQGQLHVCFGCGRLYKHRGWLTRHHLTKGCS